MSRSSPINSTAPCWEELRALHKETLDRSMAVATRAEGRIAEGKMQGSGKPIRATTVQMAFIRVAGRFTKGHEIGEVTEA